MHPALVRRTIIGTACIAAAAAFACSRPTGNSGSVLTGDAASRVYVAPGEYDEFYSFMSG